MTSSPVAKIRASNAFATSTRTMRLSWRCVDSVAGHPALHVVFTTKMVWASSGLDGPSRVDFDMSRWDASTRTLNPSPNARRSNPVDQSLNPLAKVLLRVVKRLLRVVKLLLTFVKVLFKVLTPVVKVAFRRRKPVVAMAPS